MRIPLTQNATNNPTIATTPNNPVSSPITDKIKSLSEKGKNKYFELLKLVFLAQKGHFDMVVSSGVNKLISVLLAMTGIKKRYGYDTGKLSQILLTKTVPLNKKQYACAMYHDLISPITSYKTELPEINVAPQEKIANTVLIHPGVSKMSVNKGMVKTVGADVWADTVSLLLEQGKHVMLAGGPDDKEVIENILVKLNPSPEFVNSHSSLTNSTHSYKGRGEIVSQLIQNPYNYHNIDLGGSIEWDEDFNIIKVNK